MRFQFHVFLSKTSFPNAPEEPMEPFRNFTKVRGDIRKKRLITGVKGITNEKRGGLTEVSFDRSGFKLFSL
jgi:hypothetical protein